MHNQRQFVIHKHTRGDDIHWDLMIEDGDVLKTWRLENPPEKLAGDSDKLNPVKTKATPIQDHDKKFLTYQGPVNKNTGTAEIVDEGTCEVNKDFTRIKYNGNILKNDFFLIEDNKILYLQKRKMKSVKFPFIGKAAFAISLLLMVFLTFAYSLKPDSLAAMTFFPAWSWGLAGIIISLLIRFLNKRFCILMIQLWAVFFFIFADEPRSFIRQFFVSNEEWQSIPAENKLRVISLNCLGGNPETMQEVIPLHPDILLLQEIPTKKEVLENFAAKLFGSDSAIAYDADTAIIANGKFEKIEFSKPKSLFVTQVHAKLKNGIETDIFSIHLEPPVANINLFSPDCWHNHADDRKSRRKQVAIIAEQLKNIPKNTPIILGGDFNVSSNDGCLKALKTHIKDTFNKAGTGWGHTALNTVPLFRIDQIWANDKYSPIAVYAKKTINSDHRIVISDLKMTK
ncbi:MAG: endonuclease/exonuclease/phosphatase family protein [Phycisphaerales bacterium]